MYKCPAIYRAADHARWPGPGRLPWLYGTIFPYIAPVSQVTNIHSMIATAIVSSNTALSQQGLGSPRWLCIGWQWLISPYSGRCSAAGHHSPILITGHRSTPGRGHSSTFLLRATAILTAIWGPGSTHMYTSVCELSEHVNMMMKKYQ